MDTWSWHLKFNKYKTQFWWKQINREKIMRTAWDEKNDVSHFQNNVFCLQPKHIQYVQYSKESILMYMQWRKPLSTLDTCIWMLEKGNEQVEKSEKLNGKWNKGILSK